MSLQPVVPAATINLKKLKPVNLISEGRFTEVYLGTYRGNPCAIQKIRKVALPTTTKAQFAAFMKKVLKMEKMTHRNIIR